MRRKNLLKLTSAVLAATMLLANPSITSFVGNSVNQVQANTNQWTDFSQDGFNYRYSGDSVEITGFVKEKENTVEHLVIPDTVTTDKGTFEVDGIDSGAFRGDTKLKTVTLGKNIIGLYGDCFAGCTNLERVQGRISEDGCTGVCAQYGAFENCYNLKTVDFSMYKFVTLCEEAFYNCKTLEIVDIRSMTSLNGFIDDSAFKNCPALKEVIIPFKGVVLAHLAAFNKCPNASYSVVDAPDGVTVEFTNPEKPRFAVQDPASGGIEYVITTGSVVRENFIYIHDNQGLKEVLVDGVAQKLNVKDSTVVEFDYGLVLDDGQLNFGENHTIVATNVLGEVSKLEVFAETPTTQAPTTEKATTQAPTTQAPTTEKATEAPTTEAPDTEAPVISYKGQKLKNGGNYKFYIEKDEEPEIFFSDNKEMQSLYCDSDLLPLKNLNSFSYPFGHYLVTHGPHVLTLIDASGNKTAVTLDFAVTPTATTQAPTTQAPTTEKVTTQAPTTQAPTTQAPTTEEPDTVAPMISYKGEPLKNGQKYKFNIAEGEEPTLDFGDDKGLKSLYVGEDALPIKNPISFSYVLSHQYATYGERTYTLTDYAGNKTTVTIEFSVIPATTQAPTTEKATQAPTTQAPTTEKVTEASTTQAPTTQAPTTEAPDTTLPGISYKGQKLENGGSYKFTIEESEQPSIFFSDNKGLANIYRGTDCVPANGSTGFYLELGYYLATHGPHALSVVDTSGNETKVTVEFATTQAPTTQAPTTAAPTTEKVTQAPTTQTPTTEKVTQAPTTQAPTTAAPTTEKVTVAPTTEKVTETPTTAAPTTEKVTTESETEQPIVDVEPDKQVTKLKTVYYKNKIKLSFDTSKIKKLRVNGKVVKSGKQLKKDGKYVVEFTDVNDNVSVGTYVIDTKKPVIKTKRVSGKLKMTVKDANLKSVTVKGKKQKVKNGTTTVTFKKKGKYVVKAIDAAGNLKKVTIKVK